MIEISFDKARMEKAQKMGLIAPKETARAAASAINRTVTKLKTMTSVDVRKTYRAKARDIKKSMKTTRATAGSLTGEMSSTGSPLPLTAFKVTRPARGPMKAAVLKGGAPAPVPGMFARKFPSGYTGPMLRLGSRRYPLKTPAGPSVPQMIGNEKVLPEIADEASAYLNKRMEHELEYRMSKLLGG